MASNQTEKSRYESRYSDGFVTAPQYITELICEKLAHKKNEQLKHKFWTNPTWAKFFRQQILAANGLLKIYGPKAIIRALKSNASFSVYSLRAPQLDSLIKKEAAMIEQEEKNLQATQIKRSATTTKPRARKAEKNTINRLNELDLEGL